MTEETKKLLEKEKVTPEHGALLSHVKSLVKMSRSVMSNHYSEWDHQDQVYRGEKELDKDDRNAARKGKPTKMVVPNTYAQVHTFSSFLFLMFNQNKSFFELTPSGDEDHGQKRTDIELVVNRDWRRSEGNRLLFQHLTDLGRFGPSILECSWKRQVTRAFVAPEPTVVTFGGASVETRLGSEWAEFVKFEGNEVKAVSPYRFFPDTSLPLVDFQRGEFCASEEEYGIGQLKDMEKAGEVAGVDRIEPFGRNALDTSVRGGMTRTVMEISSDTGGGHGWLGPGWGGQSLKRALVTKVQVRIVPAKFEVEPGKKLGPEEHQVLYHIWYANDNRIIKCEPAFFWHDRFSWTMSHFTPDMHRTVNLGLADLIYRLQDVITWHINSRITDVRRNMRGRLIIDPAGVDTSKLDGEGDIFLRKSASKSGVNRWVQQLQMQDTTAGHMTDAEMLSRIMEVITGVNGNAMGQYNSGRRSAQEARVVTAGAAGRMKMHGHLIWEAGLAPLADMMVSNQRQSLSQASFNRIVGASEDPDARYAEFKGTPDEVICNEDYTVFDSTLASEKGFAAQSIQELLSVVLSSNPQAAMQLGMKMDASKMVEEIQRLRGDNNPKRFYYPPGEAPAPLPPTVLPQPAAAV